jgi:phosphatidylinositol-3,4,5-trisphosphate 3-phosphatase/dual-specificity protein phosphatase PTEN
MNRILDRDHSNMFKWIRAKVSKKKRRFREDHFDLDMTYIGDRIIAMGYPAQGVESLYRNPFEDVRQFLEEKHHGHYIVYNLCTERSYDSELFDGRVLKFPFSDHNPPRFDMIREFCVHASNWLKQKTDNVIVVHCKAGKGRTGVMICALLLYCSRYTSADECMQFYGEKRTLNGKGVTIPSQRRFVRYFERFLKEGRPRDMPFQPNSCKLNKLVFVGLPHRYFSEDLIVKVKTMDGIYVWAVEGKLNPKEKSSLIYDTSAVGVLTGDFRICAMLRTEKKEVFYMWFNSTYINDYEEFCRDEIDRACKSDEFDDGVKITMWTTKAF